MEKHTTIAVDLSKTVFEVAVSEVPGRLCERKRLSRGQMVRFFANRAPATVFLEACGSAHHWARVIQPLGHEVLLLPPHQTRPYGLRDKTDSADACALLEAHRNEKILPVPAKTVNQQALASLHRIRSGWIQTRTARLNAIRGILREFGLFIPVGPRQVLPALRLPLGPAAARPDPASRPAARSGYILRRSANSEGCLSPPEKVFPARGSHDFLATEVSGTNKSRSVSPRRR